MRWTALLKSQNSWIICALPRGKRSWEPIRRMVFEASYWISFPLSHHCTGLLAESEVRCLSYQKTGRQELVEGNEFIYSLGQKRGEKNRASVLSVAVLQSADKMNGARKHVSGDLVVSYLNWEIILFLGDSASFGRMSWHKWISRDFLEKFFFWVPLQMMRICCFPRQLDLLGWAASGMERTVLGLCSGLFCPWCLSQQGKPVSAIHHLHTSMNSSMN